VHFHGGEVVVVTGVAAEEGGICGNENESGVLWK
jgi:hypothetical protein